MSTPDQERKSTTIVSTTPRLEIGEGYKTHHFEKPLTLFRDEVLCIQWDKGQPIRVWVALRQEQIEAVSVEGLDYTFPQWWKLPDDEQMDDINLTSFDEDENGIALIPPQTAAHIAELERWRSFEQQAIADDAKRDEPDVVPNGDWGGTPEPEIATQAEIVNLAHLPFHKLWKMLDFPFCDWDPDLLEDWQELPPENRARIKAASGRGVEKKAAVIAFFIEMPTVYELSETEIEMLDNALECVRNEYLRARRKHAAFNSPHEAAGVIQEEIRELWDEVHANAPDRMIYEAMQVAAMAVRTMTDIPRLSERQTL